MTALLSSTMDQPATNVPAIHEQPDHRLRHRLRFRLAGMLVLLALAALLFMIDGSYLPAAPVRSLIVFLLIGGGLWLAYSILTLLRRSPTATAQPAATTAQGATSGTLAAFEEDSLKILYEVVAGINTAHGLDDLLTRFLYTLKRFTQARGAAIWLEDDQHLPELAASSGIDETLVRPDRQEVRRCLYERAATEGKLWIEHSLAKCEKIAGRPFFEHEDVGLVSLPMRYRGRIVGVINLFLDNDIMSGIDSIRPLLTSISHHIGIAIEKYHDDDENREHLVKEERIRIAHELHDSLAQSLASLRLQVRVLDETMHQGDESTTWQQLERIENSLDEANTELRGLIANFRAPSSSRGLIEAIEQLVKQFRNETRIRTYLQRDCTLSYFSKETEIQILRIIQEALWNIRKHSQAKTVRILLRDNVNGLCHVLIEDDGVGINKQVYGSPGEHVGLTIMHERASKIGGNLRIESEPGEGTRVVLEVCKPDTSKNA